MSGEELDIRADALTHAITELTHELRRLRESDHARSGGPATKRDLKEVEGTIMSAISDFARKQEAFNARTGTAVDGIVSSITNVVGDVETLNALIAKIQASAGTVSPEDQASLDALEAAGEALSTKTESLAAAAKALDDMTPPKPPTA